MKRRGFVLWLVFLVLALGVPVCAELKAPERAKSDGSGVTVALGDDEFEKVFGTMPKEEMNKKLTEIGSELLEEMNRIAQEADAETTRSNQEMAAYLKEYLVKKYGNQAGLIQVVTFKAGFKPVQGQKEAKNQPPLGKATPLQ